MSDMSGIAGNAVAAYQQALTTVSNNIANVGTEGYSRQDVAFQALPVTPAGALFLGSGVAVNQIKRQYNDFVESNLRNSYSNLAGQEPMLTYANRVVDIMGGQSLGLNTALDQFFSSARSLSSDPSSSVRRSSFVRDAQVIADRFGQLSTQLDLVGEETQHLLDNAVGQINATANQLALVNSQLTKQATEAKQPPDLLDQRDLLLKQLAGYTRVNTSFSTNGTVTVSLGASINQDVLVKGNDALRIAANYSAAGAGKITLVLDPYGKPSSLNSITSGSLSGLLSFRDQVLDSTRGALNFLAQTFALESNAIQQQGIDGYGDVGQALFRILPQTSGAAAGLQVAFEDPLRVATAAQFRVMADANNPGSNSASIRYSAAVASGPAALDQALVNNAHPSAARTVNVSSSVPATGVASIAQGLHDVVIYLNDLQPGQQLQLLTRDGRHLLGQSMVGNTSLQGTLLNADNGFAAGASYSANYLNISGDNPSGPDGYKAMNVFYGAQAQVQLQPTYNSNDQISGHKAYPALLEGGRLQASNTGIAAGALVLNGVALTALADPTSGTLQAPAVVTWINAHTARTGVIASAKNEIRIPQSQLKFGMPLVINGTSIDTSSATSVQGLVATINAVAGSFSARSTADGDLVLSNSAGLEGQDLGIAANSVSGSSAHNALGLTAGVYRGQLSLSQKLINSSGVEVRTPMQLGFGSSGTPIDLSKLGFRAGAHINGAVKDELLVFVTGAGLASVSASYAGQAVDPKQSLRSQPLTVRFTSASHYTITDNASGTLVAERDLVAGELNPAISYQGLHLSLGNAPSAGDVFRLDGNQDGVGNNDNILLMAALEGQEVVGGKTLTNAYIDQVNEIGNIAHQAAISQTALTVVHEQAVKSREQISGVSLDQEAADLIRYQQAYQAAAKALQVASQLFESILQVH